VFYADDSGGLAGWRHPKLSAVRIAGELRHGPTERDARDLSERIKGILALLALTHSRPINPEQPRGPSLRQSVTLNYRLDCRAAVPQLAEIARVNK
jgi:hypothetical protein